MLVQQVQILLLIATISLFCFETTRATCPTPDVFEYKFEQAVCVKTSIYRRFPSAVPSAGDMAMPTGIINGGVGLCSVAVKEVNGVQQSYLNGIFGVSLTNPYKDPRVALVSTNTIDQSGIKSGFDGGFTLEFFFRPHFNSSEFSANRNYLIAEIGDAYVADHTCDAGRVGYFIFMTVKPDGSVVFEGEINSSTCAGFSVSLQQAGQSVLEKDAIHHISINVVPNSANPETETTTTVSVTKVGGSTVTGTDTITLPLSTSSWSDAYQLRLGAAYVTSVSNLLPWDGDVFYASGHSSGDVDLKCRTVLFNTIVDTIDQLPVAGEVTFTTDEDVPLQGFIEDFGYDYENDAFNITFTQLPPPSQGDFKVDDVQVEVNTKILSTKDYTFEPAENFNGDVTFQIIASATDGVTVVSTPRTATITIAPVNDEPSIVVPTEPYTVRPGLEVQITVQATDDEDIDGADYEVNVGSDLHQGKVYTGVCSGKLFEDSGVVKSIAGKLSAQGEALICYVPNTSTIGLSGTVILFEDSITIKVTDKTDKALIGTKDYRVDVVNALQGCGQASSTATECAGNSKHEGVEDPTVTLLQLHGSDGADRSINFRITKLPLHGKLFLDDNNGKGAEVTAIDTLIIGSAGGSKDGVSINIHYQPHENYYNALRTTNGLSNMDLFGTNIGTCNDRATFDGFCPDTIGFSVETKDESFRSSESTFPLYVENVADEYSVSDEARMTDITIRPRLVDGKVVNDTAFFNFTVDKFIDTVDGDCFLYSIKVERTQDIGNFMLSDLEGLPSMLEVNEGVDCLESGCEQDVSAIGPPSALNQFLKAVTVSVPGKVDSTDIKFVVRQGSSLASDPVYEETVTVYKIGQVVETTEPPTDDGTTTATPSDDGTTTETPSDDGTTTATPHQGEPPETPYAVIISCSVLLCGMFAVLVKVYHVRGRVQGNLDIEQFVAEKDVGTEVHESSA